MDDPLIDILDQWMICWFSSSLPSRRGFDRTVQDSPEVPRAPELNGSG
jgi:hypothetical protein